MLKINKNKDIIFTSSDNNVYDLFKKDTNTMTQFLKS